MQGDKRAIPPEGVGLQYRWVLRSKNRCCPPPFSSRQAREPRNCCSCLPAAARRRADKWPYWRPYWRQLGKEKGETLVHSSLLKSQLKPQWGGWVVLLPLPSSPSSLTATEVVVLEVGWQKRRRGIHYFLAHGGKWASWQERQERRIFGRYGEEAAVGGISLSVSLAGLNCLLWKVVLDSSCVALCCLHLPHLRERWTRLLLSMLSAHVYQVTVSFH